MSGRLSNFKNRYRRVVFTVWAAMCGTLRAADGSSHQGSPIEISAPKTETMVTNVNQLGADRHIEPGAGADFSAPQALSPAASSLGGIMPLPPSPSRVTVPNRRTREWLDQRRNWAFLTPEDAVREIAMKDILNLPDFGSDGEETRPASTVERYYERMWRARSGTSPSQQNSLPGSQKTGEEKSSAFSLENAKPVSGMVDRPQQSLKSLLDADLNDYFSIPGARPNSLLEAFGLTAEDDRDNELSPQNIAKKAREKQQIQQFQELLDGISSAPSLPEKPSPVSNPWLGGSQVSASIPDPLNPFATLPGTTVNPALLPPTAPIAPVPSSLSPIPYSAVQERTAPPRPNFLFPQRVF
jgi:hypothetical protein